MWVTKLKTSPFWYARFPHPDGVSPVVSLTTKCTNKRQAVARGRDIETEFAEQWRAGLGGLAVSSKHVIDEYWETEAKGRKAAVTHIFPHLDRIDRFLDNKPYCMVTVADVARFSDAMAVEGFSPSTINRALSVWRRMHNLAGKVRLYPVKMIDWGSVRKDEPPPRDAHVTQDQIHAIFAALPKGAREIAMFGILTGLRKGQVLTLTKDRVNLTDETVTVFRKHRKNEVRHTIPVHSAAVRILENRMAATNSAEVFDVTNFRAHWERAVMGAGLKGQVRFHDLRHAFATMAAKTTPLHVLQHLLGHSDIKVTTRYSHARASDMRAALKRLPGMDME